MFIFKNYTNYESGAVRYPDGDIEVDNFGGVETDDVVYPTIDIDPPKDMVIMMRQHEADRGHDISADADFFAFEIPEEDIQVVISRRWA